jgi:excisionase family DNA binding protein
MIAKHVTTTEAGHQLGVTNSRVRQLILAGRIEATNIGGVLLIRQSQVDRYKRLKNGNGKNGKQKAS